MKECSLNCILQSDGYCMREDIECEARIDSDLMTEDEYDKGAYHENK